MNDARSVRHLERRIAPLAPVLPIRRDPAAPLLLVAVSLIALSGCVNHYRIHPRATPQGVVEWREELVRDHLRVRLEWARPPGEGPLPAVMVHPEGGKTARKMRGVESQGMLLAAVTPDQSQVVVLTTEGDIPPGSAVS